VKSPTYWHPILYQTAMRLLYGRSYRDRYERLAQIIPDGSSVVDLCCGDAYLYRRFLSQKSVSYLGLDINGGFVRWLQRRGIEAREFDVRSDEIPGGDIVLMQASLYQFIPSEKEILGAMIGAARRYVILVEPVRNLSSSASSFLSWLGASLTDPGTGKVTERFDTQRLMNLVKACRTDVCEPIAEGREFLVRIVV